MSAWPVPDQIAGARALDDALAGLAGDELDEVRPAQIVPPDRRRAGHPQPVIVHRRAHVLGFVIGQDRHQFHRKLSAESVEFVLALFPLRVYRCIGRSADWLNPNAPAREALGPLPQRMLEVGEAC